MPFCSAFVKYDACVPLSVQTPGGDWDNHTLPTKDKWVADTTMTIILERIRHEMNETLDKINYGTRERICEEIFNTTFFTSGLKKWNITNLLRKFNISSKDLYNVLNETGELFCKSILTKYYNKVNNTFLPYDVNDNLTPVEINIIDLNAQTYGKIIRLLENNLDNEKEYVKWKDNMISKNTYVNNIFNFIF